MLLKVSRVDCYPTTVSVHQDEYFETKTKRTAQKQNIRNFENYERIDWEKMINELKHKQKYHSIVIVEGFYSIIVLFIKIFHFIFFENSLSLF